MRLILALGAAVAATTVLAYAQEQRIERTHVVVRHDGAHEAMDADGDGWVTRAESSAGAERMFAAFDRNNDGRLTEADRPPMQEFEVRLDGPHEAPDLPDANTDNCTRTESGDGDDRRVTIICRTEREVGEHGAVIIHRHDGDDHDMAAPPHPPHAPHAPMPPHPPMFMFMLDDDSEADLNSDGAISLDEFRAQHLRLFDAHDANGDGRVRAHRPPEPPEAPLPPTPPSPPRRG